MGSTYKTNRYMIPLLEVVGANLTRLNFFGVFVLDESERQNNFVWTLERLKGLFYFYELMCTLGS